MKTSRQVGKVKVTVEKQGTTKGTLSITTKTGKTPYNQIINNEQKQKIQDKKNKNLEQKQKQKQEETKDQSKQKQNQSKQKQEQNKQKQEQTKNKQKDIQKTPQSNLGPNDK